MASEYVSSPVLQPATQTRSGRPAEWNSTRSGMVVAAKVSNTAGSRKKLVTWMSTSRAKACSSSGSACSIAR